ncbi:MAG TPA: hypothetical protein VLE95_06050 [Chlamydiales bacterium]|nr:hypothetical protein [Chlamydiales bacterium]
MSGEEIRVMPVARSPESNAIILTIAIPKEGEIVSKNPVLSQFRVDGFALGADSSQLERSNQLPNSDMGQTVHIVIDNHPYFAINEPAIDPFNENGYFYDSSYRFEIPFALKNGMHIMRIFPARSFGESLKGANTFHMSTFYIGHADSKTFDYSKPFLTYNEPSDQIPWTVNQPVLLDFLLANCELTPDGYTVQLTVDGIVHRALTSWQPYYVYGLAKGKHTFRLQLMNKGVQVAGPFNTVERTIVVYPK